MKTTKLSKKTSLFEGNYIIAEVDYITDEDKQNESDDSPNIGPSRYSDFEIGNIKNISISVKARGEGNFDGRGRVASAHILDTNPLNLLTDAIDDLKTLYEMLKD